jgi:N-acetyl-gamma-glutamyl-phosphate reductase
MEQEIGQLCGRPVTISFTPHLVPMARGILSTIYATLTVRKSDLEIYEIMREYYRRESFVRICRPGELPATQYVRGSNYCDIGFKVDTRTNRLVILSAIDNVVKGAAGQAVQNMNLMAGLPEGRGLEAVPLFP